MSKLEARLTAQRLGRQAIWGERAMQIISDYPLYAKTSGITYEEAIAIAKVFEPDTRKWAEYIKELED